MTDNIEHLMLEHMRQLRAQYDNILAAILELNREMHAMRHHTRANELDIEANRNSLAHVLTRVDRIERRLELADGNPPPTGFAEDLPPYQPRPPKRG